MRFCYSIITQWSLGNTITVSRHENLSSLLVSRNHCGGASASGENQSVIARMARHLKVFNNNMINNNLYIMSFLKFD